MNPATSCRVERRMQTLCLLAVLMLVTVTAAPVLAGTAGSAHDMATNNLYLPPDIRDRGTCTVCHHVHGAADASPLLWPRQLNDGSPASEVGYFLQNGNGGYANYVVGSTILCYDCHVNYSTNPTAGTAMTPNDAPLHTYFAYLNNKATDTYPQDIAFGQRLSQTIDLTGTTDTISPSSFIGYYEMYDKTVPSGTVPIGGGATGGHFWKSAGMNGTPTYNQGDKLECTICHDPHRRDTTNDAFFRATTDNGNGVPLTLGTGLKASHNTRAWGHGGAIPANTGRQMCAACHGYSDNTTQRKTMWQIQLPSPPSGIAEHSSANTTTACTNFNCHPHNAVYKSCAACHGDKTLANPTMWPNDTPGVAPNRAGKHLVHVQRIGERLFAGVALSSYNSGQQRQICAYCHEDPAGNNFATLHNTGTVNVTTPSVFVHQLWQAYASDFATADTNALYQTNTISSDYQRCLNVDCHYSVKTTSWYGTEGGNCNTCHNSTANGTGVGTTNTGSNWPNAGSHQQHAAVYAVNCADCHTGYFPGSMAAMTTASSHVNGNRFQVKVPDVLGAYRMKSAGTVLTSYSGTANGTCANVSCHAGTVGATNYPPAWGSTIDVNTECMACHRVEAAADRTAATQYNSGISGLHARTGWITGENHTAVDASPGDFVDAGSEYPYWSLDDSANCVQCHNTPAQHFTTLTDTALATLTDADFRTYFKGSAASAIQLNGAGPADDTCTVVCHSDTTYFVDGYLPNNPPTGTIKWARLWSPTATSSVGMAGIQSTPGTSCDNCHGVWRNWRTGVKHRSTGITIDTPVESQHGVTGPPDQTRIPDAQGCYECHGIGSPIYNFTNSVATSRWDGKRGLYQHGNSTLEMNPNATGVYTDTTLVGCDGCHPAFDGTGVGQHSFAAQDTSWGVPVLLPLLSGTAAVNNPAYTACNKCHGGLTAGTTSRNYWPDVVSGTGYVAPRRAGRHAKHVNELAQRFFGLTSTQILSDPNGINMQKQICAYCHEDPLGPNFTSGLKLHKDNVVNVSTPTTGYPNGFIHQLWQPYSLDFLTLDLNAVFNSATANGSCTTVDCHNNKLASGATYGWYAAGTSTCTMCHTAGGTGWDPVTGLHNITTASGVTKHNDTLSGGCQACHTPKPMTHIYQPYVADSDVNTDRWLTRANLSWVDGTTNRGSCSGTGLGSAAGCHSDGGKWNRLWSKEADTSSTAVTARCNVCHGVWTQVTNSAGWRNGVTHFRVSNDSASARGKVHDPAPDCNDCHAYTSVTNRHDTTTHLVTVNTNGTSYARSGASAGCTACHGGATDVDHNYPNSIFGSEGVSGRVPNLSCASSLTSCHGNAIAGTAKNNYWPDQAAGTTPDRLGRHTVHVDQMAQRFWGQTYTQVLNDVASDAKQKIICAYCHEDPRGANFLVLHSTGTVNVTTPSIFVHQLWQPYSADFLTADGDALFGTATNGTCTLIDCHNNKTASGATYGWYAAGTTTCTLCHTSGGTGWDPVTGLHSITTASGVTKHNETLTGGCQACHVTEPTTHIYHPFVAEATNNTDRWLNRANLVWVDGTTNRGDCSGTGLGSAAGCHSDNGNWNRLWSKEADTSNSTVTARCNVCHGVWSTVTNSAGWRNGTTHFRVSASSADIRGAGHDTAPNCNDCHAFTSITNRHDTTTHLVTMNSTGTNYSRSGANAGCSSCHGGATNTTYNFPNSVFGSEAVGGPPPNLSCASSATSCHGNHVSGTVRNSYWPDQAAGTTPDRLGRHTVHVDQMAQRFWGQTYTQVLNDAAADAKQKQICAYCHEDPRGTTNFALLHKTGTVNVTTPSIFVHQLWQAYSLDFSTLDTNASFSTATNGTCTTIDCHNNQPVSGATYGWYAAGTSTCTLCHTVGGSGWDPVSGLHNITTASGVTKHNDTLTGGCQACHATEPTTHIKHAFVVDAANNNDRWLNRTNMTWADGTTNRGGCSGTGLGSAAGCHSDSGGWKRLWSKESDTVNTAVAARCNVCHGIWTSVSNSAGWRNGTTHYKVTSSSGDMRGKGHDESPENCNDCHAFTSITNRHDTTTHLVTMNTNGTSYARSGASAGCTACHGGATNVSYNFPNSVFGSEGVSSPTPNLSCASSTTNCHGDSIGGSVTNNFWPDGSAAPDRLGRHTVHIDQMAQRFWGQNYAQVLNDAASALKQKIMCAYCHEDPQSANFGVLHKTGTVNVTTPSIFVHQLWQAYTVNFATNDTGASFSTATNGTCALMDCHNNKTASGSFYGWYAGTAGDCMLCHTSGGTGWDPVTGVHNMTSGALSHNDLLMGGCEGCHTPEPLTHIKHAFVPDSSVNNDRWLSAGTLVWTEGATNRGSCAPSCHSDFGNWRRLWSKEADSSSTAIGRRCNVCHGMWSSVTNSAGWRDGVTHFKVSSSSTDTRGKGHDGAPNCNDCHAYTSVTGYHNTNLVTMNTNGSSYERIGASAGCSACHGGATNANYNFPNSIFGSEGVSGPVIKLSCASSTTDCHGNHISGTGSNSFWPDQAAGTTPDRLGRHTVHVDQMAQRFWGQTYTQVLNDGASAAKQKIICAYCHEDPQGGDFAGGALLHKNGTVNVTTPSIFVHQLWQGYVANFATNDTGASFATTTNGTCTLVDCHNNKTASGATYGWYAAGTTTCTLCHTAGGTGWDPVTGLHNITTASGVTKHNETLSGGCQACHVTEPTTHIGHAFVAEATNNTDRWLNRANLTWVDGAANRGDCSGTGLGSAAGCHSDNGTWNRLWSKESDTTNTAVTARCNVCHGVWSTATNSAGWRNGTTHYKVSSSSADARGKGHDDAPNCNDCHAYVSVTGRHDTTTHLVTVNTNGTSYARSGASAGCTACHGGATNASYNFPNSVFGSEGVSGPPISLSCASSATGCHGNHISGTGSNSFWPDQAAGTTPDRLGRHTVHVDQMAQRFWGQTSTQVLNDAASAAKQKQICAYCHEDPRGTNFTSGAILHKNGTVNVTTPSIFVHQLWQAYVANFATNDTGASFATTTNGTCTLIDCHNNKTASGATYGWYAAGTTTCTLCHTVGGTGWDPVTGLHNITTASGVQKHDTAGLPSAPLCIACHGTEPTTHIYHSFVADSSSNNDRWVTRAGMVYTDGATNRGSCGSTITCHTDGGQWMRLWSKEADTTNTAVTARCNVCHGMWSSVTNSAGWRSGVTHYRVSSSSADTRGKGHDTAPDCDDCHGYSSVTGYHDTTPTNLITMNTNGTSYARSGASAGCSGCHGGATNASYNFPNSVFGSEGVSGPLPSLSCASSATNCHGNHISGTGSNSFWPDQAAGTTPDRLGRHTVHVDQMAQRFWGQTYTQVLNDAASASKQKQICAYCHEDPQGTNFTAGALLHKNGTVNVTTPSIFVHQLWQGYVANFATTDTGASFATTTNGTCTLVDCHNNKTASGATYGWYAAGTTTCTLCHTAGGTGWDPVTGLHNITTASGVTKHNETLSGGCQACHVTEPTTHIGHAFVAEAANNNDRWLNRANLTWVDGAANRGDCSGTGLGSAAGCHSDNGAWNRLWSKESDTTNTAVTARCNVCHGIWSTVGGSAGWRNGVTHFKVSSSSADTRGKGHDDAPDCDDCHAYVSVTGRHDTTTHLVTVNTNGTSYARSGASAGCSGCHGGATNASYNFPNSVFGSEGVSGPPISLSCASSATNCHGNHISGTGSNSFWPDQAAGTTPDRLGRHTVHVDQMAQRFWGQTYTQVLNDAASASKQKQICAYCHEDPQGTNFTAGALLHKNGTVNVTTPSIFVHQLWQAYVANFATTDTGASFATTTNGTCTLVDCHNNKTASGATYGWYAAGTTTCTLCHTAGGTGWDPVTGLHNITTASGVTKHNETLTGGCQACHVTEPTTHIYHTFVAEATNNTDRWLNRANLTWVDGAANRGDCSGTGLGSAAGCHSDNGTWNRLWSKESDTTNTAVTVRCNVCHGVWSTVGGSAGWRNGVTHFKVSSSSADTRGKGHDDAPDCDDCHAYVSVTGRHDTTTHLVTVNTNGTSYARSGASAGCSGCHGGATNASYNFPNSVFGSEGVSGPPISLSCASSATNCHGNHISGTTNSFWPDQAAGTTPDRLGRHTVHVDQMAQRFWGQTYTQVLNDAASASKQKQICAYCHEDPQGTNFTAGALLHKNGTVNVTTPSIFVHQLWQAYVANFATTDTGASFATTTNGTCTLVDCHNNKTASGATYGWYAASTTTCTMCHTAGGTGWDPVTGLHNITTASGVTKHNETLSGGCQACHVTEPTTHVYHTFVAEAANNTDRWLNRANLTWVDGTANRGDCSGTGLGSAAGCHSDNGAWNRLWSKESDTTNTAVTVRCNVCHGVWSTVGGSAGWRNGVTHFKVSSSSADTRGKGHDDAPDCDDCHAYVSVTGRHDTTTHLVTVNTNGTSYARSGASAGCSGCHGGATNASYNFPNSVFGSEGVSGPPISLSCASSATNCHGNHISGTTNSFWPDQAAGTTPDRLGRHTVHVDQMAQRFWGQTYTQVLNDAASASKQKQICAYCHEDPQGTNFTAGALLHKNGTVNVTTPSIFVHQLWQAYVANFATTDTGASFATTTNGTCTLVDCHNNKTASGATYGWYAASTTTCTMCHTAGGTGWDPVTGLHNITTASGVTKHNETLSGGCQACHVTEPTTHVYHTFVAEAANNTDRWLNRANLTWVDGTANRGDCSGTGLGSAAGCHSDNGAWNRLWSKESDTTNSAVTARCNVCHGIWSTAPGSAGWRNGVTHYKVSSSSADARGKGHDTAPDCDDCHAYTSVTGRHDVTTHLVTMNTNGTTYARSGASAGCSACHGGATNASYNFPNSVFGSEGVSGQPISLSCASSATNCHGNHISGTGSNSFWPDQAGGTTPDRLGRHTVHVDQMAQRFWGQTSAQVLNDAASATKQKILCAYCHEDPQGTNFTAGAALHKDGTVNVTTPSIFVHQLWQAYVANFTTTDTGASFATATNGTCTLVDCHNNKTASGATYGWYAASTTTCTMCHTAGGTGWDPVTGLHNITTASGVTKHNETLTGGCQACHVTEPTTHIYHTFVAEAANNTDRWLNRANLTWVDGTANRGDCSGTGLGSAAGCHSDNGAWNRLWSKESDTTNTAVTARCNVCHGIWSTVGGSAGWRNGVTHFKVSSSSADARGKGHDAAPNCNDCHSYTSVTGRHDTTTHLVTVNTNGTSYARSGASAGCAQCHGGATNASYNFPNSVFGSEGVSGPPPSLSCASSATNCHGDHISGTGSNSFWPDQAGGTTPDRLGRHTVHVDQMALRFWGQNSTQVLNDVASAAKQKILCAYCHEDPAGTNFTAGAALHKNGTVNVTTPSIFVHQLWQAYVANFATTDTGASFATATNGTCTLTDCHNNKTASGATYGWYAAGTTTCTLCHTAGGTGWDPVTGLHNITTASGVTKHNDTLTGGCQACHAAEPTTHIYHTFVAEAASNTDRWANRTNMTWVDGATNRGGCSGTGLGSAAGCHADSGSWKRLWSKEADTTSTAVTVRCNVCHGLWSTFAGSAGWRNGVTHFRVTSASADARGKLHDSAPNCNDCHAYTSVTANHDTPTHLITMNINGTAYARSGASAGCAQCHGGATNTSHNFPNSIFGTEGVTGPVIVADCTSCHTSGSVVNGAAAPIVTSTSTHTKANGTSFGACTNCHQGHANGTGGIETAMPSASLTVQNIGSGVNMQIRTGLNYTSTGHTGIHLGGTGTWSSISAKTTEAEVCWGCHDALATKVTEWGVHTDANTGSSTYNYGTLSVSNWTAATWTSGQTASPNFSYKTAAIQSTHSANFASGVTTVSWNSTSKRYDETKDAVANIRCIYCHDVHYTKRAKPDGTTATAVLGGAPYLRGTWMGNKYKQDGAPQQGQAFTNISSWGAVPRGSSSTAQLIGGYWIDQNSGSPSSGWTYTGGNAAGATECVMCHGTAIVTMDYTAGEGLWMGTNGHANAVKGGSSTGAVNIFDGRGGTTSNSNNPFMHYDGMSSPGNTSSRGFRTNEGNVSYQPMMSGSPRMFSVNSWGVDARGTVLQSSYHTFSCSKCHMPHASRLPKLMLTNCLDTKHNTWDNAYQLVATNLASATLNTSRSLSNWSSAQNCHRVGGVDPSDTRADVQGLGNGWNKVTPW